MKEAHTYLLEWFFNDIATSNDYYSDPRSMCGSLIGENLQHLIPSDSQMLTKRENKKLDFLHDIEETQGISTLDELKMHLNNQKLFDKVVFILGYMYNAISVRRIEEIEDILLQHGYQGEFVPPQVFEARWIHTCKLTNSKPATGMRL